MGVGCCHGNKNKNGGFWESGPPLSRDWNVSAQLSRRHFLRSGAVTWGFDPRIDYVADAGSRFQPWVTGGRYLTPVLTNSDYFELGAFVPLVAEATGRKFLLVIEKRHKQMLKWKTVSFPRPMSLDGLDETQTRMHRAAHVIGTRDDVMVLQICRGNGLFEGYLAREHSTMVEVQRSLTFPCRCIKDTSIVMEAVISPDHSKILLKPCWAYIQQHSAELPEDCVYLLDLDSAETLLAARMFRNEGASTVMTFDPRHAWARIAVGNRTVDSAAGKERWVATMDLRLQRRLAIASRSTSEVIGGGVQNLTYSPDGRFIVTLYGAVSRSTEFHILPRAVCIFDSESLFPLKTFPEVGTGSEVPVTPFAIFPVFSIDCRQLAFMCDTEKKMLVKIVSVPVTLTLRNLCRLWLRRHLSSMDVVRLPLTRDDIDYLLYRYVHD